MFRGQWSGCGVAKTAVLIYLVLPVCWNMSPTGITPKALGDIPWQRNTNICYRFKRFSESIFTLVCSFALGSHRASYTINSLVWTPSLRVLGFIWRIGQVVFLPVMHDCIMCIMAALPLPMMLGGSCSYESSFTVQQHWSMFSLDAYLYTDRCGSLRGDDRVVSSQE